MDGFNAKGSIGIPESVKRQIEEARNKKPVEPVQPEETSAPSQEPEKEDSAVKELLAAKKQWERNTGVSITEEDIQDYIFKGRLIKTNVSIAAFGKIKLVGTFVTQTPDDTLEIDAKLSEYRGSNKFTAEGLEHERSLRILSYSWIKANDKSIGDTPDIRYKALRSMGAHIVDSAASAWSDLNFLLKLALQEDKLIKKS